ncbi:MAG: glycosyltransferase [Pseudomonadota bacterium]|nr:glycosyltransferase [Pseudomonadota bacterium]
MKKILFISVRNPYSGRYSGDVIRSLKILKLLKKKYDVNCVYLKKKEESNIEDKNDLAFKHPNFLLKIIYCFLSLIRIEPVHFGLFYSSEMKNYLENHASQYDYLFFYHIRSSQFLPKDYNGKTILEMGDLYSYNYYQTYKYLSLLNPLKYIYYLESLLVKNTENTILKTFDRITLFSKNETKKINKNFKNKVFQIDESSEISMSRFSFSNKKNRILFVGNLGYLPNLLACKDFVYKVLPSLNKTMPDLKFSIIGEISSLNKFFFPRRKNVELLGIKKDIKKYVKSSFCGIANLQISTGVQGKVLTYMAHRLPVICSFKVAKNFGTSVINYKQNKDLIKIILDLRKNKHKSNNFSKRSFNYVKKFSWKRISLKYLKLLNF